MFTFWFWVIVIIAVIIIISNNRKKNKEKEIAAIYNRGYWDGYRALGTKVQQRITTGELDEKQLQTYINEGYPDGYLQSTQSEEAPAEEPAASTQLTPAAESIPQPQAYEAAQSTPLDATTQKLKNLNILLYVASFLIVAAVATFIGALFPAFVRITVIWLVTALFYVSGLVIYKRSPQLQPAAIAFIGTGMAIIPFGGIALSTLGNMPGEIAWFLTSIVGVITYGIAAVSIKHPATSYLTIALVLSTVLSTVAVTSAPVVWYFVALIVASTLMHMCAFFKPTWLPEVFRKPLDLAGLLVTPLTLLASLFMFTSLKLAHYEILFGVATLQYLVQWLQQRTYQNETIARIGLTLVAFLFALDVANGDSGIVAACLTVIAVLQVVYSFVRIRTADPTSKTIEWSWTGAAMGIVGISWFFWLFSDYQSASTLIVLGAIFLISCSATLRYHTTGWAWPALIASFVLPSAIGTFVEPHWPAEIYPWIFLAATIAAISTLWYMRQTTWCPATQNFIKTAFWLYVILTIVTILAGSTVISDVIVTLLLAAAVLIVSYLLRQPAIEALSAALAAAALAMALSLSTLETVWHGIIVAVVMWVVLMGGALIHRQRTEGDRMQLLLIAAQIAVLATLFSLGHSHVANLTTTLVLFGAALTSLGAYSMLQKSPVIAPIYAASALGFGIIAWVTSLSIGEGWPVLTLAGMTTIGWVLSRYVLAARLGLLALGHLAFYGMIVSFLVWQPDLFNEWQWFVGAWIAALGYVVWYAVDYSAKHNKLVWLHAAFAWTVLGFAVLAFIGSSSIQLVLTAVITLGLIGLSVMLHGHFMKQPYAIETGIYIVTLAALRYIGVIAPDAPVIVYGHVVALAFLGVGLWRRSIALPQNMHYWLAAGALTSSAALSALDEGGIYQLIFLVEHIAVLIFGALRQIQWVTWWGLIASLCAVMYFLRDYFFLWLAVLGIVIIAIVMWQLKRMNKTKQ